MELEPKVEEQASPDGEQPSAEAASVSRCHQSETVESTIQMQEDRFVVFESAGQLAAFPMSCIREIERVPAHTALPFTPKWCLGVTNIRDEIVSVTDLAKLIGAPSFRRAKEPKVIMVFGKQTQAITAVVVDRVIGMRSIRQRCAASKSDRKSPFVSIADGVFSDGSDTIFLVNPDRLFAHPEMQTPMQADGQHIHSNAHCAITC